MMPFFSLFLQLNERHVRSRTVCTFDNLRLCHLSMSWIFAHDCDHTHQTFHHPHGSFMAISKAFQLKRCILSVHLVSAQHRCCNLNSFSENISLICGIMHMICIWNRIQNANEKKNSAHKKSVTIHNSLWCQKWFIYLRVDFMLVWNKSVVCAVRHVYEFAEPMKRQLFFKPNRLPRFLCVLDFAFAGDK